MEDYDKEGKKERLTVLIGKPGIERDGDTAQLYYIIRVRNTVNVCKRRRHVGFYAKHCINQNKTKNNQGGWDKQGVWNKDGEDGKYKYKLISGDSHIFPGLEGNFLLVFH